MVPVRCVLVADGEDGREAQQAVRQLLGIEGVRAVDHPVVDDRGRSARDELRQVVRRPLVQLAEQLSDGGPVEGGGDYELYDELFADDFVDHTPQPGRTPDKAGALELDKVLRAAFPDFHAVIHWQAAEGNLVTTYKTYYGTHEGEFFGIAPTGKAIRFETVDAMRVVDGRSTEHWGVANLFSLMEQLGAGPAGR